MLPFLMMLKGKAGGKGTGVAAGMKGNSTDDMQRFFMEMKGKGKYEPGSPSSYVLENRTFHASATEGWKANVAPLYLQDGTTEELSSSPATKNSVSSSRAQSTKRLSERAINNQTAAGMPGPVPTPDITDGLEDLVQASAEVEDEEWWQVQWGKGKGNGKASASGDAVERKSQS